MKSIFKKRNLIWLLPPVLLWWALKDVPFQDILSTLSSLRLESLLILVALNAIILVLFGSRWWLILHALGYPVPYLNLVGYRLAAFGVAYFTPGPQVGGEPLQVHLLKNRQGISTTAAIASVAIDKMLEWLINFAFLAVGLITILVSGKTLGSGGYQSALLVSGFLILPFSYLLSLRAGNLPLKWITGQLSERFSDWEKIRSLHSSIQSVEIQIASFIQDHPKKIIFALTLSVITWILLVLEYWLAVLFLGINLSLVQAIIVLTAARIAFLSPMPGGLGALEAGQVLAMHALGVNPVSGISISLLIRVRDLFLGGIGLWLGGILTRQRSDKLLLSSAGD